MVLNIKRASSLDAATGDVHDVLKPFDHQVGGHTPFTSLPHGHLLKPCDERELYFYQNIPEILKTIAPLCCTTIQGSSVNSLHDSCQNCRLHHMENLVIPESIEGSPILNKRKLSKNFIVISDLTYRMRSPRILDLKLGTRQHGDHATMAKIACMTAKCKATTSSSLGIRLCGMKYDGVSIGKYEGRAMDERTLISAISGFFRLPKQLLEVVGQKLNDIHSVLSHAEGVRLFGASLLIVIEGDFNDSEHSLEDLIQIKVVDFANSTFSGFRNDNRYEGVDDGTILGLETIVRVLGI